MQRLQAMMQNRIFKDPLGRSQCHPPIIKTKFASTSSCVILKCQSCELAWARQRSLKVKKVLSNLDSEGAISCAIPKCQSCELAWAQQRSPKVRKVQSNLDSEGAISCNRFELMRNREAATKDMVPTPATQGGHVPDIPFPDGALISDDDNSFISDTESEGGFGGANTDDNGSKGATPNEGAQGPNFAIDGEGRRRSTQRCDPIERLVLGANNIRGYPETVWKSDADGRLERFNLWTLRPGLTKLAELN
jgi:hypothetical protein